MRHCILLDANAILMDSLKLDNNMNKHAKFDLEQQVIPELAALTD